MNMRTGLFGRAMSFAHLAGVKPSAKRSEEEEDQKSKKARAEDDEEDPDAEEDEDDQDPPKSKKARAEDDDEDPAAEDDEDDQDPPKSKKARAEDDDEDPDAEDDEDEPPKSKKAKAARSSAEFKRGWRAQRQRCARIFASPAAGKNPAAAAELAFNTELSSSAAIAILKTTGPAAGARARANPDLGSDRERSDRGNAPAAKGWDRALASAAGKPAAGKGWGAALDRAQRR